MKYLRNELKTLLESNLSTKEKIVKIRYMFDAYYEEDTVCECGCYMRKSPLDIEYIQCTACGKGRKRIKKHPNHLL